MRLGEQVTHAILPCVLRVVLGVTTQERSERMTAMANGQRMIEVNNRFFFRPFILSIYKYFAIYFFTI